MSSWRGMVEVVHITALGVWFGVLAGTAAAAAVVFPTMKSMDVRIPGYEASVSDNFRIAGGMVAQKVFLIGDIITFTCAVAAVATLGALIWVFKVPVRRPATMLRSLALGIALAALASMLIVVTPALIKASKLHWDAIKLGDAAAMARHKAAVDELHPMASNLMAAMAVAVLVALVAAVWSLAVAWQSPAAATGGSRYPEPALLRTAKKL